MQMQNISVRVGQDLHFDVARAANVALQKHSVIAEGRAGLGARFLQKWKQQLRALHHAHSAPAASERCLHDEWIANLVRNALCVVLLSNRLFGTRHDRQSSLLRQSPRSRLVTKQVEQVRAGTDKNNSRFSASSRQRGILRKKSVARVDGVDAALFRERNDSLDIQISLDRALALADQIRFVRLEAVQAEAIFVGVNSGCPDIQFVRRAENADRNFSAIQGQKFFYLHG